MSEAGKKAPHSTGKKKPAGKKKAGREFYYKPREDWKELVCDDVYTELATAIIKQASADYMNALVILALKPAGSKSYVQAYQTKNDTEHFFYSSWYTVLTTVDPDALLVQLRAYANCKINSRRSA